ncbi:MAG: DUF5596 domain-containing protein [Clostridia bacterium]|nr:DUF5596 domain-containing protein [Clostridia bacterium]
MIDLSRLGLTDEEISGVLFAKAHLTPSAAAVIEEGVSAYRAAPDFDYALLSERVAALTVPEEGQFLFILALLPALEEYYERKGYPKRWFEGVLQDTRVKLRECRAMTGRFGTICPSWFGRWFSLERIALERLQFEPRRYDYSVTIGDWRFTGGELINVHIPGEGPLDHDACLRSYAEAARFYGGRFPGPYVPFQCNSWLLHPEHPAFLDPRSRILAFQADYTIFDFKEKDPRDVVWRFTLSPWDGDPAHLPARNSLEKAYRDRILSGGSVGNGRGIYLYPKGN